MKPPAVSPAAATRREGNETLSSPLGSGLLRASAVRALAGYASSGFGAAYARVAWRSRPSVADDAVADGTVASGFAIHALGPVAFCLSIAGELAPSPAP